MFDILNIKALRNQIATLEAGNADWNSKYTQLEKAYEQLKQDSETYLALKDANNTEIAKLKEDHTQALSALQKQLDAKEAEIESRVSAKVASLGFNVEALPPMPMTENSPKATYEKFIRLQSEDSKAAADFYRKNREVLMNYVGYRG